MAGWWPYGIPLTFSNSHIAEANPGRKSTCVAYAAGCSQSQGVLQTAVQGIADRSQPTGCFVAETSPDSFGEAFAAAGGGVWATQFDVAGILYVDELVHFLD